MGDQDFEQAERLIGGEGVTQHAIVRYHVPPWVKGAPKIFAAMAAINREVEAVEKDRVNSDQKYKFRGIDQIYNQLHEVLAKNGVFATPRVLSRIDGERTKASGSGTMLHVKLEVEYVFTAEDGSALVVGPVWGESIDTSDKCSNKCLAFAQKYAFLQTFTIPTEDIIEETKETAQDRDGDSRQPETNGRAQGHQGPPPWATMLQKYAEIGIGRSHLEKRWKKRVEDFAAEELDDARELYRSCCEDMSRRAQYFEPPFGGKPQAAPAQGASSAASRLNQRIAGKGQGQ